MQLTLTPLEEADAHIIQTWHYEEPYTIYGLAPDDDIAYMLDRRSPYFAVRDEQGELVGFFCFGTAAQVWENDEPGLYGEDKTLDVGLGMRPDLTGQGLGSAFVAAGLAHATQLFAPLRFRLFVRAFNQRAVRVYERAGFVTIREFVQDNPFRGPLEFIEMQRAI